MTYQEFKEQFSISLNPQQEQAVQAVDGPVLLLAVPGSGKTTVLVTRLGYMLFGRNIPPEEILTMTYTVSAAGDMKRRFAERFGEEIADRLAFRTINGVCSRIIRRYEIMYGRKAFDLLEDTGKQAAIVSELCRTGKDSFVGESTIKAVLTGITYVKNGMLTEEQLNAVEVEGVAFPEVYRAYNRVLRERRLMDYDDQMVYAYQILRKAPELLEKLRRQYRYFCVDEAQDTSKLQHTIIRLLAGESRNLFLVGDEDQSIYGFRAAYPQALMEFEKVYPGAQILLMEENYRSTRQIVEAADRFIHLNRERREKKIKAVRGDGVPVTPLYAFDRRAQYAYLAKLAENCTKETAVLYRDNDSALPLLDLLSRQGLGYRCRQVDGTFFTHRIVRDITDIIHFAETPDDGELFLKIYYKIGTGVTKEAAEAAAKRCTLAGQTVLDYLLDMEGLSDWARNRCRSVQYHLSKLLGERGDQAIDRIFSVMGYEQHLEQRGIDPGKVQILAALGAWEPTPAALLDRLTVLEEVVRRGSTDPRSNFILSTIHSSKGLEYEKVILIDVLDGLFPKRPPEKVPPQEAERLLEEERRLFYVGMTRAKEELSIFRFRTENRSASFVFAVFPEKKEEPPKKPREIPKPWQVTAAAKDYYPGGKVSHKTLGEGTITAKSGDILTVSFEKSGVKKLSLSTALRSGQISKKV